MADVSQIKLPNGSVYDLIDEKSGYITAEYIENKTDYEIPVSRVGEIVVGETAIGTDSTNFPTSKAVVDYVDERVVQEMDAIDVGVTGIKANGTSLSVVDGVVNIPAIGPGQSVGLITKGILDDIYDGIPTSTSQLTNDSGFITSETDPTVPAWAKASTKPTYTAAEVGALPDSTVIPSKTSDLTNDSGFITGYTETDPVFSASVAAGITSKDISNWNAKVSDDKTWNGVSLNKTSSISQTTIYIPFLGSTTGTTANIVPVVSNTTGVSAANRIPKYNNNGYLVSTTPSANDNSTKVATTAYVDAAIPDVSGYVSKSGDTMSGNLTMSANKLIFSINDSANIVIKHGQGGKQVPILSLSAAENGNIYIRGVHTPSSSADAANKQYVDDKIPQVYSSTNTGGYLTMSTLPIYDGTVDEVLS